MYNQGMGRTDMADGSLVLGNAQFFYSLEKVVVAVFLLALEDMPQQCLGPTLIFNLHAERSKTTDFFTFTRTAATFLITKFESSPHPGRH